MALVGQLENVMCREKSQKDSESSKKNVSVRAQDDCLISRDVNIMKSNINKVKEKGIILCKHNHK
jgi:hypothetical protein